MSTWQAKPTWVVAVASVAAMACAPPARQPAMVASLAPTVMPREILKRVRPLPLAGCVGDGNRIRLEVPADEAPVVVLREEHIGLDTQEELAMWADGAVIFDAIVDGEPAARQTRMPAGAVEALRATLYERLADKPRRVELGMSDPVGGTRWEPGAHGQQTSVLVRGPDGDWRTVIVRGVERGDLPTLEDRLTEEAAAFAIERAAYIAATARGQSPAWPRGPRLHAPPPRWFVDVYRKLIAAMPTAGEPAVPYTFRLRLFTEPEKGFGRGTKLGASMPWPEDLPVPPPTLRPAVCGDWMNDCAFDLAPAHGDAALRQRARVLDQPGRRRPIVHDGQAWFMRFDPRYRGQTIIRSVIGCVERLDEQNPYDE